MKQGDKVHLAFEAYGRKVGLDMSMHPMFLLYLNKDTAKSLEIFKAGFESNKPPKSLKVFTISYDHYQGYGYGYEGGGVVVANTKEEALGLCLQEEEKTSAEYWSVYEVKTDELLYNGSVSDYDYN